MIRVATVDDIEILVNLVSLVQALHHQAYPHLFKPADNLAAFTTWFEDQLQDSNNHFYILEEAAKPIGYALAKVIQRPDTPFGYPLEVISLDHIGLLEDYQGQGYGEVLMGAVVDLAKRKNIQLITAFTWGFNQKAQAFFKKQGFQVVTYRFDRLLSDEL